MVWRSVCVEIVVLCLLTNSTKTETLSPLSLAETSHCSGLVDSQLHSTSRADCLQYLFFKVQSLWPCFFLLTVLYCSVLDRALLFYFAACHSHCFSILFFFCLNPKPAAVTAPKRRGTVKDSQQYPWQRKMYTEKSRGTQRMRVGDFRAAGRGAHAASISLCSVLSRALGAHRTWTGELDDAESLSYYNYYYYFNWSIDSPLPMLPVRVR